MYFSRHSGEIKHEKLANDSFSLHFEGGDFRDTARGLLDPEAIDRLAILPKDSGSSEIFTHFELLHFNVSSPVKALNPMQPFLRRRSIDCDHVNQAIGPYR